MRKFIFMFWALALMVGQVDSQTEKWIDFNRNGAMDVYENPRADLDRRVNDLLSQMTIEEKISLLNEVAPAIPRLGVVAYTHGNEALHGVVRPGKFTVFPQAIALAATWDPEMIHQVATAISDEARAKWNRFDQGRMQKDKFSDLLTFWSPTVNMARDPRWGRTPETYGEDPYLTSRIGVAFVKGLQGDDPKYLKVVSTPKHFVANNEEHNRFECKVNVPEQSLRNYYLPAFQALITEGHAQSIMSAYPAINGVPCSANKWLLSDVLRKEWGFRGYVVSDCSAVSNIFFSHHYTESIEDAAAAAMKAGLDLECNGYCKECTTYRSFLKPALDMGKVTEQEITDAVFRVLAGRFKLGMFDDPSLVPYTTLSDSLIGSAEHQQLALQTARESMVLLKNNGILPLNRNKIKSVAVMGINAASCEFGDYSGKPVHEPISALQGIREMLGEKKVHTLAWDAKQIDAAKALAKRCDVAILVMGINKSIEREGQDRTSIELPVDQQTFIRAIYQANPKTILVIVAGSQLSIRWEQESLPAIVNAWYPGEQGGTAIADVLFGTYNPAGRLPLTYYESLTDLPAFDDYQVTNGRTYMFFPHKPLYPFGYGLSYTTFSYPQPTIDKSAINIGDSLKVNVAVTNSGTCDGDEVVQLYLKHLNPEKTRPIRQLKGFRRIHLKQGAHQTVSFVLDRASMSYWDEANRFVVEPGDYEIQIGASSADIRQTLRFTVR